MSGSRRAQLVGGARAEVSYGEVGGGGSDPDGVIMILF